MPDGIGDISSKWDERDVTVNGKTWVRSPEQRFLTGYGEDFRVHVEMERVIADSDHKLVPSKHICSLWTRASDCATDPELGPHAIAIQEHLTALTSILWERWKKENDSPVDASS